jgi:CBS domain-containing protein
MTRSPACGYVSESVANFLATVAHTRPYRTFPVLDVDGRLAGMLDLERLAQVPVTHRDQVRLRDVLTPNDRILVLDPACSLADAAPALLAGGQRLAVVTVDGHVSGVLSAGDVSRAMELAALNLTPLAAHIGQPTRS